jgi:hypothetical protein
VTGKAFLEYLLAGMKLAYWYFDTRVQTASLTGIALTNGSCHEMASYIIQVLAHLSPLWLPGH